jgi:hypothetical protein
MQDLFLIRDKLRYPCVVYPSHWQSSFLRVNGEERIPHQFHFKELLATGNRAGTPRHRLLVCEVSELEGKLCEACRSGRRPHLLVAAVHLD